MLTKGDKLILIQDHKPFLEAGEVCTVINVNKNNTVSLDFEYGVMIVPIDEIANYFEPYEEPSVVPTVTEEMIDWILSESEIDVHTVFNKCTVVSCKLPNGAVLVEFCDFRNVENYNEETGFEDCMERITNKIWEFEEYKLRDELYQANLCNNCEERDECFGCNCE